MRHGETVWNLMGKVQGKSDIELNETGIKQAKEAKVKLADIRLDLIISSPLMRARRTAQIINEDRDVELLFDERISERSFGEFEGKHRNEFDFEGFWDYNKNVKYEKAESISECLDRAYAFLDDIKEKYKDKNILLVTHGGIGKFISCYFEGIPESGGLLGKFKLGNCEVKEYEFKM
jgi:probable phosphoglycerate mutase